MRYFVTGSSGWIGSAIVRELLASGHEVLGLARSDDSAAAVQTLGAEVLRGDLADADALRRGAGGCDGVAHTGFNHDFSNFAANAALDRSAVEALVETLTGSDKPLVISSGMAGLAPGRLATESDTGDPAQSPRAATEQFVIEAADRGVRSVAVRLPPTVHGDGDHGFVPRFVQIARDKGTSAYVGDGTNRWPSVHRLDAAHLYCLALAGAVPGTRLNAVADEGVPFRQVAEVIGRHLDVPVASVTAEEASEHFGFLGMFAGLDMAGSSTVTRELLDWTPTQPDLLTDLEAGHYFG